MEKEISFEQALSRLEEIVKKLESGGESLENSLALFEEGTKLSAYCYNTLSRAEQKITELSAVEEKA